MAYLNDVSSIRVKKIKHLKKTEKIDSYNFGTKVIKVRGK